MEQVEEQLGRKPFALPQMRINKNKMDIFDFVYEDFTLDNYHAHPHIKGDIAV